jgi:hypothetical protein
MTACTRSAGLVVTVPAGSYTRCPRGQFSERRLRPRGAPLQLRRLFRGP